MADVDGPVDASAPSDDAVAKTNPPSSVAPGSTNSPSSNNVINNKLFVFYSVSSKKLDCPFIYHYAAIRKTICLGR